MRQEAREGKAAAAVDLAVPVAADCLEGEVAQVVVRAQGHLAAVAGGGSFVSK